MIVPPAAWKSLLKHEADWDGAWTIAKTCERLPDTTAPAPAAP